MLCFTIFSQITSPGLQPVRRSGQSSTLVATEAFRRIEFYHSVKLRWSICEYWISMKAELHSHGVAGRLFPRCTVSRRSTSWWSWAGPRVGSVRGREFISVWLALEERCVRSGVSGGKILGDKSLVWSDGTPTDFIPPSSALNLSRDTPGCLAVFADLVFHHTRNQTLKWKFSHTSTSGRDLTLLLIPWNFENYFIESEKHP